MKPEKIVERLGVELYEDYDYIGVVNYSIAEGPPDLTGPRLMINGL